MEKIFNFLFFFKKSFFFLREFLWRIWAICFLKKPSLRIAFNMSGAAPQVGGVQYYAESLIRGFHNNSPWNRILLYSTTNKPNFYFLQELLPAKFRLRHYFLSEEIKLQKEENNFDLLYAPFGKLSPTPPPHPTAFHFADLQEYFFPEFFSLSILSLRRNQHRCERAFADHILVPSEFTKKSLIRLLGIPEERISVAFLPVANLPQKEDFPKKLKYVQKSFFYYPADNYLHKNHQRLFKALRLLREKGWQGILICSGNRVEHGVSLEKLMQEEKVEEMVIDVGRVSREEVRWLYRHAKGMVFPSLFEGFGIPLLEAFDSEVPVLCSGVTSLPEVAGEAALYCNPFDVEDLVDKMELLWSDQKLRRNLISLGKERRKFFNNKKMILHHEEIFEKVVYHYHQHGKVEPLPTSLPNADLLVAETLYREGAVPTLREKIPPRKEWFQLNGGEIQLGVHDYPYGFEWKQQQQVSFLEVAQKGKKKKVLFSEERFHLPIHFFTLVYNGMPFLKKHIEIFRQLSVPWKWHIVEGLAELRGDTAWSLPLGGKIDSSWMQDHSDDGTLEYLEKLQDNYPEHIVLHKTPGRWENKVAMCSVPLQYLPEEALLWQVDVDEFWTSEQIEKMQELFLKDPSRTGASFFCRFFLGPNLIADNIGFYGNNLKNEWRRVWHYKKGDVWKTHAPPRLLREISPGEWRDLLDIYPFSQQEMWNQGLVFDHYAYVTEKQLRFKEVYYGYKGALEVWQQFQKEKEKEHFLPSYFSWIPDPIWSTEVENETLFSK